MLKLAFKSKDITDNRLYWIRSYIDYVCLCSTLEPTDGLFDVVFLEGAEHERKLFEVYDCRRTWDVGGYFDALDNEATPEEWDEVITMWARLQCDNIAQGLRILRKKKKHGRKADI